MNATLARFAALPLLATALTGMSTGAFAGDDVIQIDEAKVRAAGGYPYRIDRSGSYRLAGNLGIGSYGMNVNAIEISTGGSGGYLEVTLDLNGFAILGYTWCDQDGQGGIACTQQGSGNGIRVNANANATITNGAVRGMGNQGLMCLGYCRVDNMSFANNGGYGISLAAGILTNSKVFWNRWGITASNATVQGNLVQSNLNAGMTANNSTFVSNSVHGNGGLGLSGSGNAYANNHFAFNNGGNSALQVGPANIQTGGNVCGTAACP